MAESNNHEVVTLADGRKVFESLDTYKQILAENQSSNVTNNQKYATREKCRKGDIPKSEPESGSATRGRGKKAGEHVQQQNNIQSPWQQQFLNHQEKIKLQEQQRKQPQRPQNQQRKSGSLPYVQPNYIIRSPSQSEPGDPVIRMLLLQEDEELSLINFTLPGKECTIEQFLEKSGVKYQPGTKISCMEVDRFDVNFLVVLGYVDPDLDVNNILLLLEEHRKKNLHKAS